MTILETFNLDGRVAIVTGASSGLGVAFAVALAEAGADVVLGARRTERLHDTRRQIEALGRRALVVQTDVVVPEECENLVARAMSTFGHLDILVNNAGVGTAVPATRETPDQFREVVEINLMGSYWMAQSSARVMKPGSSIINVASVLAFTSVGQPQAAYSASKSGVVALTRDLAQQWTGRRGIRVNAIAPGYFLTELTEKVDRDWLAAIVRDRVPMGRLGELRECASAVIFLASDAASFVTGTCLTVDGGLLTS